jgi:hypothetical protein
MDKMATPRRGLILVTITMGQEIRTVTIGLGLRMRPPTNNNRGPARPYNPIYRSTVTECLSSAEVGVCEHE